MTLEKGKSYGLEARTQTLLDVSRSKMEGPIPHQAPQRERVSMAALPLSKQERRAARRRRQRRWAHMLQPDKRMGVPQLMMLLEPNVVWDHTRAFVQELGVDVQAQYGRGDFLEGWHKAGRLARGVYEGSYWELIGDCEELAEMLRSMSQAPPLMEEAPLELPEQAELPKWDDYKPILQVLPSAPTLPVLRIPPFRAPILETELPFVEPELMVLPDVPEQPHEEPTPHYHPPELITMEAFEEEDFVPLEPPTIPAAPVAPKFGKPQHGYDWLRMSKADGRILHDDEAAEDGSWVGAHPFKKDEPQYVAPKLMDLPTWRHPPRPLPKLPLSENLELDEADVELEPIPKLELAWDCGPDPEPAYASISTTPVTMSRATTPAQSRPTSAGPGSYTQPSPHQSRPPSAVHAPPSAPPSPPPRPITPPQKETLQQHTFSLGGPSPAHTPSPHTLSSQSSRVPSRPISAQQKEQQQQQRPPSRPISAQQQQRRQQLQQQPPSRVPSPSRPLSARTPPGSRPQSGRPGTPPSTPPPGVPAPEQIHPAAPLFPDNQGRRPSSGLRSRQGSAGLSPRAPSPALSAQRSGSAQGDLEWESTASSVDTGRPHVWLNFNKPFADLPPVFMPDKPELGVCNGPEPIPEDFGPDDLEELPEFEVPEQLPLPSWEAPPPPKTIEWMPPCEPRPVGFMRGTAPVLILDVSGTMNPAQRGKVNQVKACACELLHPDGELGTASGLFDVIAFCNQSYAWSATYAQRLSLLSSTQVQYAGRQVGGKILPGSARTAGAAKAGGAQMMPTEPELLADAQNWVDKWPGAVGHTNMLSSYLMADSHWNADCWYLFSDGLADDPMQCIDFLESRAKFGLRCPRIHAVGFFPDDAPENYEGRRFLRKVADITQGTYQEFDAKLHRIYQEGVGFVSYDVKTEAPEATVERQWAEEQLRAERKKNIRLGIVERLDVTMARVRALHNQMRVQPMLVGYNERLKAEQTAFQQALEETTEENTARKQRAMETYMQRLNAVSQSNQDKIDAANARYSAAHATWMEAYNTALQEWESSKASLERERSEAISKYMALQEARSRTPSPPRSRPVSAQAMSAASRPRPSRSQPQSAKPSQRPPGARPISAGNGPSRRASSAGSGHKHSASKVQHPPGAESLEAAPPAPAPVDMSVLYSEPKAETSYPGSESENVMAAFAQAASSVWGDSREAPSHLPPDDDNTVTMADTIRGSMAHRQSDSTNSQQSQGTYRPTSASGRPPSARSRLGSDSGVPPALQQGRPLSAGPSSRPPSGRPASAGPGPRPASAHPTSAGGSRSPRPAVSGGSAGASAQPPKASLQQLIEEGEDGEVEEEVVDIEGEPSNLSIPGEQQQQRQQQLQQQKLGSSSSGASTQHSKPQGQASELADDGFVVEEEGEGLDFVGELPPLELEDSQELKRRIFPADVVKDLDDSNAERLSALRGEWETLLADTAARNARKLAALANNKEAVNRYINDVLKAYSSTFVRDVIIGRCVKAVTNERLIKASEGAHKAECDRIRAENAAVADLHTREIEHKRQKEAQFRQAVERWHKQKDEAWAAHERDVTTARALHHENTARMRAEWEAKRTEVETINHNRMQQAEALHLRMVEDVTAINRRLAMEHAAKVEHRKALEDQNRVRMAEARVMHKAKLQQQAIENEEALAAAQQEYQALCKRMTEGHAAACEIAQREFEELRTFLASHNDSMLEAARQKYAAAVAAAQAEWEELCAQLREEHEEALAYAREHNKRVWPQVLTARLAQEELGRVMAFAEHIKWCANKLQLGVNFMPNTPCYERVVEMQALNEALIKAFPEFDPSMYPWPDSELRLQPGTGWVAPPEAKSIDIKDPAILIMELAAGKRSAASAIAATMAGGPSATSHTTSSAAKLTGSKPKTASRPSSASAAPASKLGPSGYLPQWLLQQQEWSPEAQQWIMQQDKQQQEQTVPPEGNLPPSAAPQGHPEAVADEGMEGEEQERQIQGGRFASVAVRPATAPMRPMSAGRLRFSGAAASGAAKPLARPWSASHHQPSTHTTTTAGAAHTHASTISGAGGPPASVVPRLRIPNAGGSMGYGGHSLAASPSPQASLTSLPTPVGGSPTSQGYSPTRQHHQYQQQQQQQQQQHSAVQLQHHQYQQQQLLSGAATAPGSPHEHQRRMVWQAGLAQQDGPQVRALSAGPKVTQPSAAAVAAMGSRPVSGLSVRHPRSSSKAMPARMAVDLEAMQATVNMHRSRKTPFEPNSPAQGPRTKQQAFLSNTQPSLYSGFRTDFPKAQFPSVDVRAVGDLQ